MKMVWKRSETRKLEGRKGRERFEEGKREKKGR